MPYKITTGLHTANTKPLKHERSIKASAGTRVKGLSRLIAKQSEPSHLINEERILEVKKMISSYTPKFYDFFGYDISKTRKKLINYIIRHQKSVKDEELRLYLSKLEASLHKDIVVQDIELGTFLNYLMSKGLKFESVHRSLLKIIKAGRHPYEDRKFQLGLERLIDIEKHKLIHIVKDKLSSCKTDLSKAYWQSLEDWGKSITKLIDSQIDEEKREILTARFITLANQFISLVDPQKIITTHDFILKFCSKSRFNQIKIGKIIEFLVNEEINLELKYSLNLSKLEHHRTKFIENLPIRLKEIHDQFVNCRIRHILAIRVLALFKTYHSKGTKELGGALLNLFSDGEIYQAFESHIKLLTTNHHKHWRKPFHTLIKEREFREFIEDVINNSGFSEKEIIQYHKLVYDILSKKGALEYIKERIHGNSNMEVAF